MRKNIFSLGAVCLALSLLTSCGGTPDSKDSTSNKDDGWNISFDASSNVTAKLENRSDGNYKLVISGQGKIKDFTNASDAPYYSARKKIVSISIGDKVTYVGRNAFKECAISSVILPSAVTEIGYNIVDDNVNICSLGNTAITVAGKQTVYYYSESVPETQYRFYVKGDSTGDITDGVTDDTTKWWHYAEGSDEEAAIYNKKKVLFIGNSFTFRNGVIGGNNLNGGVPRIFSEIAKDLGEYVETWAVMGSALTLAQHANKTSETGAQIDKLLTKYSDFDYIVLQEQSTKPLVDYNAFETGATSLATAIRATNPNAKIDLYETWGYPSALNETYKSIPAMERGLFKAYNKCSLAIQANAVRPVGRAFTYVANDAEHKDSVNLYASDNMHQSYYGAYLSASVMAASILGLDVTKTKFVNDASKQDAVCDSATIEYLRKVAYDVVNDPSINIDSDQNYESLPLHIAVWGRYISETNFNTLLTAYKDYAFEHEMGVSAITYKYYAAEDDTSPYWLVKDFAAAVTTDNDADILFPVGNNINSSGNMDNTVLTNDRKTALSDISVFGQTGRYIARLNDDDMTLSFYNWILTDEAKVIMDPTYEPSTEPDPADHGHDLEVAVWGRFITEENFLTLWNGFKATGDFTGKDLHYTYYEGTTSGTAYYGVAAFTAGIKKNGGASVVFPAGSNIADAGNYEGAIENIAIGVNVFGAANRYIAYYEDTALAKGFKDYILSDDVKKIMDPTYEPPAGPDLVIAVWGRYISETNWSTLLTAFEATAAATDKTITYKYYEGASKSDTYYNVDPFCAAVKADGGADIIFPAGGNIVDKYGKDVDETTDLVKGTDSIGTTVFGQTGRVVAWLNENTLTLAFKNWLNTEDALKIMNSEYEPPVDYSLHIAVWGRYISEANWAVVLNAFKDYCSGLETPLDTTKVTYTYSTTNANADYVAEVEGLETFADVIFPAGKATNGALSADHPSVHNTALEGDVFGETSRYIVTRSSKTMAETFYSWIISAEGKAVYNTPAA